MMAWNFDFGKIAPLAQETATVRSRRKRHTRHRRAARFVVPDKLVGSVAVKQGQEVRAYLHHFQGATRLNLRLFVQKDGGEWIPTKAGFTVRVDLVADLGALLGRCGEEAPAFEAECARLRALGLAE